MHGYMEIGGINRGIIKNTIDSTVNKVSGDDFGKRLQAAVENRDDIELKKACREFEGIILNMLFKQMKAAVPKSEFLENSMAVEIFDSMLDEKLMEEASKRGSLGLADTLYKQLGKQLKTSYNKENEGE